MKFRSTLILLIVGAALGAYLFFVERKSKSTRELADVASHVVEFERDKIDAISLRSPETKVELRKKDNNTWVLEEPAKDRADSTAVNELLTAVDVLRSDAAVDVDPKNKEQLKEFGVVDSTTKVKFTGAGKTTELILGKDTAVEGKSYIYVDGASKVHVVANDVKTKLQKKGDDFRDRKLADFGPTQVTKAEIKSAAGLLELTKVNNHWNISKPLQARGDDSKINDLIASALNAHIEDFGSDASAATSGLNEPRGTVTFTQEGVAKPVILSLGQNPKEEKDKEKTWAKLSTRDALVLVPKAIEKVLETKPNDLRDKNLVRVESDIVDRVTVEPAGGAKFVVGRKGESWVGKVDGKDVPINDTIPPKLLADLQAAQVVDYVSDVATELPKYGLDQPVLKVTFSSYASENTSETNAGDKPIVTVFFGKSEGPNVYAKVDSEPFVVSIPQSVFNSVPKSALELQELTIFNDKPEEFSSLEVTKEGQPTLNLEKDKDTWKLTKGDGKVDQANVMTLLSGLAHLKAVRWLGPTKPDDGIDKPAAVITGTLTQNGQKATRKLTVGAVKDDMWNATAESHEGTFQISRPDHDLLTGALTDQPAPTPAAPAAGGPAPQPMPPLPDAKAPPIQLPSGITSSALTAPIVTPLGQPAGAPAPSIATPQAPPVPPAPAPTEPTPPAVPAAPAAPAPLTETPPAPPIAPAPMPPAEVPAPSPVPPSPSPTVGSTPPAPSTPAPAPSAPAPEPPASPAPPVPSPSAAPEPAPPAPDAPAPTAPPAAPEASASPAAPDASAEAPAK